MALVSAIQLHQSEPGPTTRRTRATHAPHAAALPRSAQRRAPSECRQDQEAVQVALGTRPQAQALRHVIMREVGLTRERL